MINSYVLPALKWFLENSDMLKEAALLAGLLYYLFISRARGQALDTVTKGIARAGDKVAAGEVKKLHEFLGDLAANILHKSVKKARAAVKQDPGR